MYSLHQLPKRAVETKDSNSLEAALKELREETGLKICQSRPKWIGYDLKYDCNVYAIELDIAGQNGTMGNYTMGHVYQYGGK